MSEIPDTDWGNYESLREVHLGSEPKPKMNLGGFLKKYLSAIIGLTIMAFMCGGAIYATIQDDKINSQKRQQARDRNYKIMSHVGEKVVIEKDTAVIINVNFDKATYILNDEREISIAFITNRK